MLLSGTIVELRKAIVSFDLHMRMYESDLAYQFQVYIRPQKSVYGHLDSSSPALDNIRPIVDQIIDTKQESTSVYDEALNTCERLGAKYILYLEDKWETRNFDAKSPLDVQSRMFTRQAPVMKQAMDLLKLDPQLLEVWVGDVPQNPNYKNQSIWYETPWKEPLMNLYRNQFGTEDSSLAITRPGASVKDIKKLRLLPTWKSLESDRKSTLLADQGLSSRVQTRMADKARDKGFYSAHFCMTRFRNISNECHLDLNGIGDKSTTGLMWRQRVVTDEEDRWYMWDRP
ncbi:hypothetical protein EDD86DRAFT_1723 [Gorgonomyces haynaldii]|nr:hypothetical protein EDD86DRAFT_1723 [Gorgonomyces haynaldii]